MELIGRTSELARLEGVLAAARGGESAALLVVGEAGIGKTSLLEAASAAAGDFEVLRARGIEAERELSWAALFELLQPYDDRLDTLPGPQREALEGAFGLSSRPANEFAVAAATAALLAQSGEERPTLVLLDDLQWVDRPSAAAIVFAARRVHEAALATVLSLREPLPPPVDMAGIEPLAVRPLDDTAANELAAHHGVPPSLRPQLVREAAGNPLVLVELASSPGSIEAGAEDVAERLFGRQVDGLDEEASTALLVAALDDTGDAAVVVPAAGGTSPVRRLEDVGLLHIRAGRLELRHPLVRSLVLSRAWQDARRDAHARLADALPIGDEQTRHRALAAVAPDTELADELESLAKHGGADSVWALERAAALTPQGPDRARRLLAAARAAFSARDVATAERLLGAAKAAGDQGLRHDATELEAQIELVDGNLIHGADLLEWLASELEPENPGRAARLLIDAVPPLGQGGEIARAARVADRARTLVPTNDSLLLLLAEAAQAESRIWLGQWRDGHSRYREAASRAEGLGLYAEPTARLWLIEVLYSAGLYDKARELATAAVRDARRSGALGDLHIALASLFSIEFACGRIAPAAAAATEELEFAAGLGRLMEHKEALGHLAWCAAHTGDEERCRRLVRERYELSERLGDDAILHPSLGLLELGLGNAEAAVSALRRTARTHAMRGHRGAIVPLVITADLAEALLKAGHVDEARTVVADFESEAHEVGRSHALSLAYRCRGLLAEQGTFDAEFETALEYDEDEPRPFERARTILCWGERLRRVKRRSEARRKLAEAYDELDRLGSTLWAGRAQAELAATGLRPRRRDLSAPDTLTPQERNVVKLVAEGLSNRELAASLYVSTNTIETHMRHIFQKLGVRSRVELARAMNDTAGSASRPKV
jgi:ATP/maltotriose-dependent transcriptional regulator MalT